MKTNRKKRRCDPAICYVIALAAGLFVIAPAISHAQTVNTTGLAAEAQGQKDVDIESDEMQIMEAEKLAIFTGNVDARRGTVKLTSDKLVVHYEDAKKQQGGSKTEVTHLDATGQVVIITKSQRITGSWAKMDVKANQLNVGGNVVVTQGKTVIKGKKLFVDLNTNVSKMTGGRVKGSFVPSGN